MSMIGVTPRTIYWITYPSGLRYLMTSEAIISLLFIYLRPSLSIFFHRLDHCTYISPNLRHYSILSMPALGPCQTHHITRLDHFQPYTQRTTSHFPYGKCQGKCLGKCHIMLKHYVNSDYILNTFSWHSLNTLNSF